MSQHTNTQHGSSLPDGAGAFHADTQYDNSSPGGLDMPLIIMVGAISVVLFAVTFIATEAWFYNQQRTIIEKNYLIGDTVHQNHIQREDAELNQLHRVEGQAERVTIPVDRAIELYVQSRGKK